MVALVVCLALALPASLALLTRLAQMRMFSPKVIVFMLMIGVTPAGSYIAWQVSPGYGIAYAFATYLSSFIWFIDTFVDVPDRIHQFNKVLMLLATMSLMPSIMSRIERFEPAAPKVPAPTDLASISASVRQIHRSISTATDDIRIEQAKIQQSTLALLDEIDRQNRLVKALEAQRNELARQVKQQRAIAGLTGKQVEAIRAEWQRGKYFDYIVGFVSGIVASLIASGIMSFKHVRPDRSRPDAAAE